MASMAAAVEDLVGRDDAANPRDPWTWNKLIAGDDGANKAVAREGLYQVMQVQAAVCG